MAGPSDVPPPTSIEHGRPESPRPSAPGPGSGPGSGPAAKHAAQVPTHSPELLERWAERRAEAIEAVRNALESGALSREAEDEGEELAKIVHKLAGTAAMFGEAELGDQAAAFERALAMKLSPEVREALAFELLTTADDPVERRAAPRTS